MNLNLSEYVFKVKRPCVFKNILVKNGQSNTATEWTPQILADILKNEILVFRIGKKLINDEVQFENQCEYVDATIKEYLNWINKGHISKSNNNNNKRKLDDDNIDTTSSFQKFDINEHWAYADYKYMINLVNSSQNSLKEDCIDWSFFGFEKRNAIDSTLWIGTKNAYTPCHYDSYGYNFVAQIYGTKRWIMFPNTNTQFMYPTRIPFEESTIYSKINIKLPNMNNYPKFKNVEPYVVDLNPGDVLYVPHNWWHYVESLTDSISINSWVDLKIEDDLCRLKEILSKYLIQSVMDSNLVSFEQWINSTEDYSTQEENLEFIKQSLNKIKENKSLTGDELTNLQIDYEQIVKIHPNFSHFVDRIPFEKYINEYTENGQNVSNKLNQINKSKDENMILINKISNILTDPTIVESITKKLLDTL